jgi:hypothetical protein
MTTITAAAPKENKIKDVETVIKGLEVANGLADEGKIEEAGKVVKLALALGQFEKLEVNRIYPGNALDVLKTFPAGCVSNVATSPPFWALRKYRTEPQIWGGDPACDHDFSVVVDTLRKATPGDVPSKDSILGRQIDNHTASGSSTLRNGKIYPGEKYNRDAPLKAGTKVVHSDNGLYKSGLANAGSEFVKAKQLQTSGREIKDFAGSSTSTLEHGKGKTRPKAMAAIHESHNGTGASGLNGLTLKDGSAGQYNETSETKARENSELRPGEPSGFCSKCHAWKGHLGLEPTVALYVEHLCDIFDEVYRVLRDDGTCFVDMGDSYGGSGGAGGDWGHGKRENEPKYRQPHIAHDAKVTEFEPELRLPADVTTQAKSMCMVPWLFMFEMVRRGWILRNVLSWDKAVTRFRRVDGELVSETIGSCMPSSVTDNFTPSWEPVFFFVKSNDSQVYYNEHTLVAQRKPGPGTHGVEDTDWHWIKCPRCEGTGIAKFTVEIVETMPALHCISVPETHDLRCQRCKGEKRVKDSYWASADYWFERQFVPLSSNPSSKERRQYDSKASPNKFNAPPEAAASGSGLKKTRPGDKRNFGGNKAAGYERPGYSGNEYHEENLLGANMRSAFIANTSKTKDRHFATYSLDLVLPLLRAGCPKEICSQCGLPRYPVVVAEGGGIGQSWHGHLDDEQRGDQRHGDPAAKAWDEKCADGTYQRHVEYTHCTCNAPTVPGINLDPFFGTATNAIAAIQERRNWVGIELSEEYIGFAEKRLARAAVETAPTAKHRARAKAAADNKIGKLEGFL